jgi:hypothetical protein
LKGEWYEEETVDHIEESSVPIGERVIGEVCDLEFMF